MAGRVGYGLFAVVAILLGVDAALGEWMRTFTSEEAAQRHCPARHRRMAQHIKRELSL